MTERNRKMAESRGIEGAWISWLDRARISLVGAHGVDWLGRGCARARVAQLGSHLTPWVSEWEICSHESSKMVFLVILDLLSSENVWAPKI
jgi:hypothetical protein